MILRKPGTEIEKELPTEEGEVGAMVFRFRVPDTAFSRDLGEGLERIEEAKDRARNSGLEEDKARAELESELLVRRTIGRHGVSWRNCFIAGAECSEVEEVAFAIDDSGMLTEEVFDLVRPIAAEIVSLVTNSMRLDEGERKNFSLPSAP
jgi:hypothetical protein